MNNSTPSRISVFICEDDAVAKAIIEQFFDKDEVTYAATFPEGKREQIVAALDALEQ